MDSWFPSMEDFLVLVAVMDSLWIMVERGFFMEWMPKWIFDGIGADHGLFSLFFGVFYFFTGWKTMNFVVAADLRGIPGNTVHNQLLCVEP